MMVSPVHPPTGERIVWQLVIIFLLLAGIFFGAIWAYKFARNRFFDLPSTAQSNLRLV